MDQTMELLLPLLYLSDLNIGTLAVPLPASQVEYRH